MKYKCLVLDHDDTVVDSSASIHYPSFVEYLKIARPHLADKYTVEEYFEKNFHPGILELFTDEIGLSEAELAEEEQFWRDYVKNHIPHAYPGMKEIIADFKAAGGIATIKDAEDFIALGAERLGTSRIVKIAKGLKNDGTY